MSINHIRLGEMGYALIRKDKLYNISFIRDEEFFDGEVSVVPAIVTSIHMDDLVTVSIGEPAFKIPADQVFYNRVEAENAAKKHNAQYETMEEEEFELKVRVTGVVTVTVKAKNARMAERIANNLVEGMTFGQLKNIDWEYENEEEEVTPCYYR